MECIQDFSYEKITPYKKTETFTTASILNRFGDFVRSDGSEMRLDTLKTHIYKNTGESYGDEKLLHLLEDEVLSSQTVLKVYANEYISNINSLSVKVSTYVTWRDALLAHVPLYIYDGLVKDFSEYEKLSYEELINHGNISKEIDTMYTNLYKDIAFSVVKYGTSDEEKTNILQNIDAQTVSIGQLQKNIDKDTQSFGLPVYAKEILTNNFAFATHGIIEEANTREKTQLNEKKSLLLSGFGQQITERFPPWEYIKTFDPQNREEIVHTPELLLNGYISYIRKKLNTAVPHEK